MPRVDLFLWSRWCKSKPHCVLCDDCITFVLHELQSNARKPELLSSLHSGARTLPWVSLYQGLTFCSGSPGTFPTAKNEVAHKKKHTSVRLTANAILCPTIEQLESSLNRVLRHSRKPHSALNDSARGRGLNPMASSQGLKKSP